MEGGDATVKSWFRNSDLMYSILCGGIVVTLIYWPLLNSIFCMAMMAYWLFFSKKQFSLRTQKSKMVALFCVLYVVIIFGCFNSEDVKEAAFKLQQKLPYLIFPIVFGTTNVLTATVVKNTSRSFILATISGCIVCVMYGLYQYLFQHTTYYLPGYSLIILKNMHPVVMGLCCILSLIFLLESAHKQRNEKANFSLMNVVLAVILIVFVFLVGNRSNLITILAVLSYYGFKLMPRWKHRLMFLASFFIVVLLAFLLNPFLQKQWRDLVDFSKEKSVQLDSNQPAREDYGGKTLRLAIWQCAIDVIKRHPIDGVGTGDVYPALEDAYKRRQFNAAIGHKEYNAHNQYLQESIAYGVGGGLLLIFLIVVPFSISSSRPYRLFLFCFAVVCLTEGFLELNKGIVWYAFFNSFLFFYRGEHEKQS